MLQFFRETTVESTIEGNFGMTINIVGETIRISETDLNEALHFPTDDLVPPLNGQEIQQFF